MGTPSSGSFLGLLRGTLLPALILAAASPLVAQADLRVEKVAEGVYAVMPPEAMRFDESNAAVVLRDDGVLVVDTQSAPSVARAVLARIRQITPKPVRWVVNTHWHGDHVQGNSVYLDAFPGVQIVAHAATREDIEARAMPQREEDLEETAAWVERARRALESKTEDGRPLGEDALADLSARLERRAAHLERLREVTEFIFPTRTFEGTLDLFPGDPPRGMPSDRPILLKHFAGHTRGDVVVHLPGVRVLITGDLLDDLPFTGHGSPRALVETLRALGKLEFDAIIPGHGRVRTGDEARDHLRRTIELFDTIVTQASAAATEGLGVEETKKRVDVSALRDHFVTDDASDRYWDFFIGEAITRARDEAAGR